MDIGQITQPAFVQTKKVPIAHSDFTAAAQTETLDIWTIPPKAVVVGVQCVVTETPDDDDGDLTNWNMEFGEDDTPDTDAFLTSHDYIADGAGTIYQTEGAALSGTQGRMYSVSASKNLTCKTTIAGAGGIQLDDAGINAGGWDVYITYIQHN